MKLYIVCYPIYVHKIFGQHEAAKEFYDWLLGSGDFLEEEVILEEVELE